MRMNAQFQVLDEPVRPVGATILTGLTDSSDEDINLVTEVDNTIKTELKDWRIPIMTYLKEPDHDAERNIQCFAFKHILIDGELYRRTTKNLLLKCLDSNQARVAMGEVHEDICGRHQSAPKIK